MSRFSSTILILLFLGGFVTAFLTAKNFAPDDDLLYFYTAAQSVGNGEEYKAEKAEAAKLVETAQHTQTDPLIRFNFRDGYKYNYLYDVAIMALVREAMEERITSSSTPSDYLESVRDVIYNSVFLSHGLAIFLLLYLVLKTRREELFWPYFAALSLSYAGFILEYFQLFPNVPYRIINSDLTDSMKNPILSFLHPGLGFGLFYTNARNIAVILATGIFLLRWKDNIPASYWMVVLLSLVHTTSASLLLILLVGLDYIQQPEKLKNFRIIVAILLVILISLAQSLVWHEVGAGMSFFALLPLGVFLLLPLERRIKPVRAFLKIERLDIKKRPYWDSGLLIVFLFILFFLLWGFFYSTGHSTAYQYTLAELPIRLLSLLRFPILMGVMMFIYSTLSLKLRTAFQVCVLMLSILLLSASIWHIRVLPPAEPAGNSVLALYKDSLKNCHSPFSEKVLYYLMACKLDNVCQGIQNNNYLSRCYPWQKNKV